MTTNRFFAYDPEGDGFTTHATLDEARRRAEDAYDYSLEGSFPDVALEIRYGEIRGGGFVVGQGPADKRPSDCGWMADSPQPDHLDANDIEESGIPVKWLRFQEIQNGE